MWTHVGIVDFVGKKIKVKLVECEKAWRDANGKLYLKTNGKRPQDNTKGIYLMIDSIVKI